MDAVLFPQLCQRSLVTNSGTPCAVRFAMEGDETPKAPIPKDKEHLSVIEVVVESVPVHHVPVD